MNTTLDPMRKIVYAQLVSLDGYIEDRNGKIGWTKPGEEVHRHFNELEKKLDLELVETQTFSCGIVMIRYRLPTV